MDALPIFVVGFMAAGKSTVGRLAAARLGVPFVDLDARIETARGKSIRDIFKTEGEATFRRHEAAALAEVARAGGAQVVACGGGTPCFGDNLEVMRKAGVVVALLTSFPEVLARAGVAGAAERPLLADSAAAERLYREREAVYRGAEVCVATEGRPAEEVAEEVARRARLRLGDVRVQLGPRSHPIHVAPLGKLGELARECLPGVTQIAVITDENVAAAGHARAAGAALEAAGLRAAEVVIPAGEASKQLAQVERVAAACVAAGLDRRSAIIAVGGGVVGDLAGFVAATLFRGIAVVQVPTTLLAMIDSSIGGKTGVDLPAGKNLIGAFWQPRFVLADAATLSTLPEREHRAAWGEIVKYALLGDAELFTALEAGTPPPVTELILRCARLKADCVAADEREETGARAALNLGHTVGHAIEAASGWSILHGEAVALGLLAAARASVRLGVCDEGLALEARVRAVLTRLGLDTDLDARLDGDVFARLAVDKKRAGAKMKLVAIEAIGRTRLIDLTASDLRSAVWPT